MSCRYRVQDEHPVVSRSSVARWIETLNTGITKLANGAEDTGPWVEPGRPDDVSPHAFHIHGHRPSVWNVHE